MDEPEPMDVSPVRPSIPQEESRMASLDRTLKRNDVALEAAAEARALAKKWKRIAIRELMRRPDFPALMREGVSYGLMEMDHAEQEAAFWVMDQDTAGNIGLERQS